MIELGVLRTHLLKKVLPFALAASVGVASAGAWQHFVSPRGTPKARLSSSSAGHSRTWLWIHERPIPAYERQRSLNAHSGVRLVARFKADGTVSVINSSDLNPDLPDEVFRAAATNSAERILFTPATEDGRPLSALAEVTYELGLVCFDRFGTLNGRRFGCYGMPSKPSVKIISVEGSEETEDWHVVYE